MILNFSTRCNMACAWCYVPFRGGRADVDVCTHIVQRCAELNVKCITFGGGDPFAMPFLGRLLNRARHLGLFIHVDTNGVGLRETSENASLVSECIDLLGLPLDGPDAATHDRMRGMPGHFATVLDRFRWLTGIARCVKINTIVTGLNVDSLSAIGTLVAALQPSRWSLYQYWPLSSGRVAATTHAISDAEFLNAASPLAQRRDLRETVVEVVPAGSRRRTYPLLSHDGSVYVHSESPERDFDLLGSFFDERVVARVVACCGRERPDAAARYAAVRPRSTETNE